MTYALTCENPWDIASDGTASCTGSLTTESVYTGLLPDLSISEANALGAAIIGLCAVAWVWKKLQSAT